MVVPALSHSATLSIGNAPPLPPPGGSGTPPPSGNAPGNETDPWCNPQPTPTPSALLIPTTNPVGELVSGGHLTVSFQIGTVNYTGQNDGEPVYLPSIFATFPLVNGTSLTVYFPPATWTVQGSGWASPSFATKTITAPWDATFSNASALLSTQKIALMAPSLYGNLTLEVRWQWSVAETAGSETTSAWTDPSWQSGYPNFLASILYPAPYVTFTVDSANPVTIGSTVQTTLGGDVAGRYFLFEVEFPTTGSVFQSVHGIAGTNNAAFNLNFTLLNYDSYLDPGTYLLHVHDSCGALLYSVPLDAVYASSATVTFNVSPASCGPVTFDGSTYASGTSATVPPSETPYSFAIPSCSEAFQSWTTQGGLHVSAADELLVSASGTLTVNYS